MRVRSLSPLVFLVVGASVAGCGSKVADGGAQDGATDSLADVGADATDAIDAADTSEPVDTAGCEAAVSTLSSELTGLWCTVTLRVSQRDLSVTAYDVQCAAPKTVSEPDARAAFDAVKPPYASSFTQIGGANPKDAYVYYQAPGDFGGVGVVSARTGLVLFSGSLTWSGIGEVIAPKTWNGRADLGAACDATAMPTWRAVVPESTTPGAGSDLAAHLAHSPVLRERTHALVDALFVEWPRATSGGAPDAGVPSEWIVVFDFAPLE